MLESQAEKSPLSNPSAKIRFPLEVAVGEGVFVTVGVLVAVGVAVPIGVWVAVAAGVKVADVGESRDPLKRVYDPSHPLAGADGYVLVPNVDSAMEMVDMISSSRGYEANLAVARAAKEMIAASLRLGA